MILCQELDYILAGLGSRCYLELHGKTADEPIVESVERMSVTRGVFTHQTSDESLAGWLHNP